jgi:YVTN family beta-propeller protein
MRLPVGESSGRNLFLRVAGITLLVAICISCGDEFRPIAIPITPPLPDPQAIHAIFVVSDNGFSKPLSSGESVNPGGTSRLDVSGDSNLAVSQVGLGPMHAAIPGNGARIYVANALEDTVSSFSPSSPTAVTTTSLPSGSTPMFLESKETATMYVANYDRNTVGAIITATNVLASPLINVGTNPVALVETPDGKKLYSVNQGSGDVTPITTSSRTAGIPIPAGTTPVWAVARSDSARVYVLDSGSGNLFTINTLNNAPVATSVSAGAGANFMAYDRAMNRVYIVNPNTANLTIADVSSDAPQALSQIAVCTGCHPVSVAVLPDGTRAYVGSYMLVTDPTNGLPAIEWQVAVINAQTLTPRTIVPADPSVTLFDRDTVNPTGCGSTPFGSSPLPFRISVAASGDSSKVFVSSCDAGSTAVIQTSSDTLVSGLSQMLLLRAQPASFNPTSVTITAATQNGSTTTYSYSQTLSGPSLRVGMRISITGMQDAGNNGSFSITALGSGSFRVTNATGVSNSGQSGTGIAVPFQNPVFTLAGP